MFARSGIMFMSLVLSLTFTQVSLAADKPYKDTPVDRFAKVEEGLYRGGQPKTVAQLKALRDMGIRTIVSMLNDEKQIAWERAESKKLGMKYVAMPLPGFNAPADWRVEKIQNWLADASLRPLYLHCAHGRERTGVQIGLYRVFVNGWTPQKAYKEMKAFGFRSIVWPMKDYFEEQTDTDL